MISCLLSGGIRRSLIGSVLGVGLLFSVAGCGGPPPNGEVAGGGPPPIILIVIDTLRADFVGSYGFDGPISPNLDELARESVLFEKCQSQAPWTTPSVAAMMTSLYPDVHGVRLAPGDPRDQRGWRQRWTRAIPDDTTTLAEVLRERGYRTTAFVANPFLVRGLGFEQGFDHFDESLALSGNRDSTPMIEAALEWLRSMQTSGEPTFAYLHLMDVHGPYTAPETDFEAVRDAPGLGRDVTVSQKGFDRVPSYLRSPPWTRVPTQRSLRLWRGRYAAGVHAADRRLGRLVQGLRDADLWNEQLVIVTSDHGEALFDHGGWDHGFSLYEHQIHVPLMARLPGGRHGGTRVADLVRLVDVMPTLVQVSGATPLTGMVGSDVLHLATAPGAEATPRLAFSTGVKEHPEMRSIYDGRYKLITEPATFLTSLYDVAADPGERTDLSSREPEVVRRLSERLVEENARVEVGSPAAEMAREIPPEQLERLKELGYVE